MNNIKPTFTDVVFKSIVTHTGTYIKFFVTTQVGL